MPAASPLRLVEQLSVRRHASAEARGS